MSTHGLGLTLDRFCLYLYNVYIIISMATVTCSRHDITEKNTFIWR